MHNSYNITYRISRKFCKCLFSILKLFCYVSWPQWSVILLTKHSSIFFVNIYRSILNMLWKLDHKLKGFINLFFSWLYSFFLQQPFRCSCSLGFSFASTSCQPTCIHSPTHPTSVTVSKLSSKPSTDMTDPRWYAPNPTANSPNQAATSKKSASDTLTKKIWCFFLVSLFSYTFFYTQFWSSDCGSRGGEITNNPLYIHEFKKVIEMSTSISLTLSCGLV